jgi:hypothetical protein
MIPIATVKKIVIAVGVVLAIFTILYYFSESKDVGRLLPPTEPHEGYATSIVREINSASEVVVKKKTAASTIVTELVEVPLPLPSSKLEKMSDEELVLRFIDAGL